jgi:hypothetical protein
MVTQGRRVCANPGLGDQDGVAVHKAREGAARGSGGGCLDLQNSSKKKTLQMTLWRVEKARKESGSGCLGEGLFGFAFGGVVGGFLFYGFEGFTEFFFGDPPGLED